MWLELHPEQDEDRRPPVTRLSKPAPNGGSSAWRMPTHRPSRNKPAATRYLFSHPLHLLLPASMTIGHSGTRFAEPAVFYCRDHAATMPQSITLYALPRSC